MDILALEQLPEETLQWLGSRGCEVRVAPEADSDPVQLLKLLPHARGLIVPRRFVVGSAVFGAAPRLQAVAHLGGGIDNIDLLTARRANVAVINPASVTVRSDVEFVLAALVLMNRRGLVSHLFTQRDTLPKPGRELFGSTVGVVGLGPMTMTLVPILKAMGVRVVGYDPAVHASSGAWEKLDVPAMGLVELLQMADAVVLNVMYGMRYHRLLGEQYLRSCKPGQLWVSLTRSDIFDPDALAGAMREGRIDACVLDSVEEGFAAEGSPLHGMDRLMLTPRMARNTVQARARAAWFVVRRMHEVLQKAQNTEEDAASAPIPL